MRTLVLAGSLALGLASTAGAAELKATMHKITEDGVGASLGTVTITEGQGGAVLQTDLKGLPPGEHGLHVHQNADCGPGKNPEGKTMAGFAAGGHWDPEGTKAHKGPEGSGPPRRPAGAEGEGGRDRRRAPRGTARQEPGRTQGQGPDDPRGRRQLRGRAEAARRRWRPDRLRGDRVGGYSASIRSAPGSPRARRSASVAWRSRMRAATSAALRSLRGYSSSCWAISTSA